MPVGNRVCRIADVGGVCLRVGLGPAERTISLEVEVPRGARISRAESASTTSRCWSRFEETGGVFEIEAGLVFQIVAKELCFDA